MVAIPEFEMGQTVRVRQDGGDPRVQPDMALRGKEGTISAAPVRNGRAPVMAYFVEFGTGDAHMIGATWLELT